MLRKLFTLTGSALLLLSTTVSAQEFAEKNATFSYKKTVYVYLENGDSLIGTVDKIGYKKGLVDELKIKKAGEKKGVEVDLNTVKKVYFPLADLAILGSKLNVATTASKWEKSGVNEALIKEGYVLYEKTPTTLKGKEEILLMQLINPAFSNKIRVYADPYAAESQSFGVKGITLAGGDDLSYYIKVADRPAVKVRRKDFKENITSFFSDCPALEARLKENSSWGDLPKYVFEHSDCARNNACN